MIAFLAELVTVAGAGHESITIMPLKAPKIPPKLLWGLGFIALVGIVCQLWYDAEIRPRKCCGIHPYWRAWSILRCQQARFEERERFAESLDELGLGLNPENTNGYDYSIETQTDRTIVRVLTQNPEFRSYIGAAFVIPNAKPDEAATEKILCEAKRPGLQSIAPPIDAKTCGKGTVKQER
jgi:Type IV pilin-like G and H, putative